ncbi:uncharacterized protein N7482_000367 [Penicillium canariense]|uniref:Homeobox domain-containing protein n=1 Tax=Penicillium canariense TaxID=189055 RepID=A0A9W9IE88_9EURO|nr:uncharacterized protein N7482_000367 [Penicillium canariense]KAJ5174490.1 hypothetical protein N7482_000367 [Penicillium canariense]
MSDPEPSAAASSSPSLPATDSSALTYAFLVHSQKTLTQNLPPRVDNKLLARQKRRRTSPEDHAILEAQYQINPKPDKLARTHIVNRVSLGEKEVQIWFQNRRQNDRRKSKPLQPHELLAPRSSMSDSSGHPASDDNASAEPGSSSGAEQIEVLDRPEDSRPKSWGGDLLQLSDGSDPVMGEKDEIDLPLPSTQTSVATEAIEETPPTTQEEFFGADSQPNLDDTLAEDEALLQATKRKRSVSDIRGEAVSEQPAVITHTTPVKSPPSLRLSLSFDGEAMVRKEDEMTPSPPKGRNSLRIAMSSDGKAVIRGENEPSPSKNRVAMFSVRRPKLSGLRRSSSAIFPATPRAGMTEKDRVFGRSRDPRNWESFFDTDARSALSSPMSSQTAPVSSPGLFQSRSQRSLTRSASQRHSMVSVHADAASTPISQSMSEKRRKLSRTVSSLGRLETERNRASPYQSSKLSKHMTSKSNTQDLELDPGDSDKENWIPGTRSTQVRRRTTSHAPRPVLREANRNRGLSLMSGSRRNRQYPSGGQGKAGPDLSAEVSAFMTSGAGGSQEDDLDCVQGLLSLSQGAWR